MVDPEQAATSTARADVARPPAAAPMGPKRLRHASGAAVALVLIALGYWWMQRAPAPHYLTGTVTRGDVQRTVTASGTVNPMTTVQVGTYVSGVLQDLHCDFNTEVKAGQLCAKIDPRPYQSIVDQETAALGTARAQLAKDQANLAFAKVIYDRDVDLLKRRIVSQETVDAALNAWQQAQAQVALDESTIAQRLASLSSAKVNLDYTNIISPVSGTVVSRNVTQGQTVAASFQTPTLFLIATDLTQMQVDTNVSESDVGGARVGEKACFSVGAYPDQTFCGQIYQVRRAPITVQNVVTSDVVVSVDNPDLKLLPGMTANMRIITDERDKVVRVPVQALKFSPGGFSSRSGTAATKAGGGTRVWVLRDGKPVRVPITVGLDDGTYAEVVEGDLEPGDQVVVNEVSADNQNGRGSQGLRPPGLRSGA
jgi:HlyD family secretion protein